MSTRTDGCRWHTLVRVSGRRVKRLTLGLVGLLVLVLAAASLTAVGLVRRAFPQTDGELQVPGLSAPVTVLRDSEGVPHLYADTATDLFTAQGYVAAQDRFFQMDLRRHITSGRLAELVGEAGVEPDTVIRTLGWRRVAEQELPRLAPDTRRYLQSYAAGVNAYLEEQGSPGEIALEYTVLGQQVPDYTIEPWTELDSLTWLKAMAWDLRGNDVDELARARLAGSLSAGQLATLYPEADPSAFEPILSQEEWQPPVVPDPLDAQDSAFPGPRLPVLPVPGGVQGGTLSPPNQAVNTQYVDTLRALDAIPPLVGSGAGLGSNSWVVSGDLTSTGAPLLANDPHLALSQPSVWQQVGLHCNEVSSACPYDVSGFSFAGFPGVVIGRNSSIAWGFTNLNPDVTDYYLEEIDGDTYRRGDEFVPLETREEVIQVGGGDPVTIEVRSTGHGPIVSDVREDARRAGRTAPVAEEVEPVDGGYALSMAWTGLEVTRTADAVFLLNRATDWEQFRTAAQSFAVPSQNLVYADVEGNIGYQAPGLVPVRRSAVPNAVPGYWPAPGWDPAYDWVSWVPFRQMPYVLNPEDGMIVAANQQVSASPQPFLTSEWYHGYRSQRITDLLRAEVAETGDGSISPQDMVRIQTDTTNDFAPILIDALLQIDLDDPFYTEAQDLLRDWDGTAGIGMEENSAAAAYYYAVWSQVLSLTFDDELPSDLHASGNERFQAAITGLLDRPEDPWWDDRSTTGVVENRDAVLERAQINARLELTRRLGKTIEDWDWGRLHTVELQHEVLGGDDLPGLVRGVFNRGPFPAPGGSALVNAMNWDAGQDSYEVVSGPSMRMVADLSDPDASLWVNHTGASGHPFHPNYEDQTSAWLEGRMFPWLFTEEAVRAAAEDELRLLP